MLAIRRIATAFLLGLAGCGAQPAAVEPQATLADAGAPVSPAPDAGNDAGPDTTPRKVFHARPAGCTEALRVLDRSSGRSSAVTAVTPNADGKLADIHRQTADDLAAIKAGTPEVRAKVHALAAALHEVSIATNEFDRVYSTGKVPDMAIQGRLQRAGAARFDAEKQLRAACPGDY